MFFKNILVLCHFQSSLRFKMFEDAFLNWTYLILFIMACLIFVAWKLRRDIGDLWSEVTDENLKLLEIQEDINNIRAELDEYRSEQRRRIDKWEEDFSENSRSIESLKVYWLPIDMNKFWLTKCDEKLNRKWSKWSSTRCKLDRTTSSTAEGRRSTHVVARRLRNFSTF